MAMMKCGHAANATDEQGNPVCLICYGWKPGADEVDDNPPSLEGREAKCVYCGRIAPSSEKLPFFGYCCDKKYDEYYCGCRGWD
jgi:hypothetical protein